MQAKLSEGKVIYKENMFPFTKNKKKIKNVLLFYIMVLYFFQEENKEIALGTSKLNYLDPRISVAW